MTTGDIEPYTLCECHTMIVQIDYTFGLVRFCSVPLFPPSYPLPLSWVNEKKCLYRATKRQRKNHLTTVSWKKGTLTHPIHAYDVIVFVFIHIHIHTHIWTTLFIFFVYFKQHLKMHTHLKWVSVAWIFIYNRISCALHKYTPLPMLILYAHISLYRVYNK